MVQYAQDRLWYGEPNVKGYLKVSVAMAKAEVLLDGSSVKDANQLPTLPAGVWKRARIS